MVNLTVKHLDAIKPRSSRKEYPDERLKGLYFIVQPSGAQSWAVRYRFGGTPRKFTIGKYPAVGLAEARSKATEALAEIAKGVDPAALKNEMRSAQVAAAVAPSNRLSDVVEEFLQREVEPKQRSAVETRCMFEKRVLPAWGHRQIDSISRADVVRQLDQIVAEGLPIAANKFFALVRRFFNWAIERGIIDDTPCKGQKAPSPIKSRDRVLSDDEIRWLWQATLAEGYPFGPLVRLLLLTGQRRDEVAGMSWGEVDVDEGLWTVPRERAKNDRTHYVPLSDVVLSEIQALPRVGVNPSFIFTTNGRSHFSGYSKAKRRLDTIMLELARAEIPHNGNDPAAVEIPNWRLHDLRRTAASGMARQGQPVHVVEAILNHKSGAVRGVAAIYNRYDYAVEKRDALATWGEFVLEIKKGDKLG